MGRLHHARVRAATAAAFPLHPVAGGKFFRPPAGTMPKPAAKAAKLTGNFQSYRRKPLLM